MGKAFPISDGRLVTTSYDDAADELTLIIETAEGDLLLSVVMAMDEARELAGRLIEGYVQDLDITPEKIIRGERPSGSGPH